MEEEDRLSSLPDDLLHSILRELPFKHAVRTSALSRRWAPQWLRALASSRVLDFTDRDLARGQLPARAAAATMRRCLELHAEHGAPLDVFRVALMLPPGSSDGVFGRDVVGWIASAVARGAREVEVELIPTPTPTLRGLVPDSDDGSAEFVELPGDLFVARNSLARLALGGFSLGAVPAAPGGLAGLRSLSLSHVDLAGEAVRDVVSSCRALEHLRLSSSGSWRECESIRIASETLRVLEIVGCIDVKQVRVTAPALESIAFHDDDFFWEDADDVVFDFDDDMPALRDVYLSRIRFAHDSDETEFDSLLSDVEHAPVWTLSCDGWNLRVRFDTTNIQELQLLIASEDDYDDDLEVFAGFFQENELPLLDRLFLRFPGHVTDASDADAAAAPAGEVVDDSEREIDDEFVLDSLSFIKLVNFRGTRFELQLLAFFLKRAPALKQLVLVTGGEEGGAPGPGDEHLEVIQRQVSAMRKASPHARLTVCGPCQDRSQNPVHTRLYDEE
ncbi:unnamed protein product [Miscanthus lutarioriparius]|uniref:F-box domain-containing protein n=1 Tax=Miscanthus lutarioriparius TaxID=422564 RepID=A0A811NQW0_9POAL|nr:unnamed protein product [Miscanthus lutarioriparius]